MKAFLAKNSARAIRLSDALDKLFDGTDFYTSVEMEWNNFRGTTGTNTDIDAWVEATGKHYHLKDFANMTAMITQIKHDVKEARK